MFCVSALRATEFGGAAISNARLMPTNMHTQKTDVARIRRMRCASAMCALNRSLSSWRGILLNGERRRMAGEDLFLAALTCEFGAPDFLLAFLVDHERSQR